MHQRISNITVGCAAVVLSGNLLFRFHLIFYMRFVAGFETPFAEVAIREYGWLLVCVLWFTLPLMTLIGCGVVAWRIHSPNSLIPLVLSVAVMSILLVWNITTAAILLP